MIWLDEMHHPWKYWKILFKWGLMMGVIGGLLTVGLYRLFGSANVYIFAYVCVIAYVISGNWGLYASQIIQFSKARLVKMQLHNENANPSWFALLF